MQGMEYLTLRVKIIGDQLHENNMRASHIDAVEKVDFLSELLSVIEFPIRKFVVSLVKRDVRNSNQAIVGQDSASGLMNLGIDIGKAMLGFVVLSAGDEKISQHKLQSEKRCQISARLAVRE